MLMSFSVPEMRPMVEAGVKQWQGHDVGTARVKRQTIRKLGPKYAPIVEAYANREISSVPLHLWWKSRTPEKEFIGQVDATISRCSIDRCCLALYGEFITVRINPRQPGEDIRLPQQVLTWNLGRAADEQFIAFDVFARADGFNSAREFADYFAPECGDRFEGALFRW